MTDLNKKKKWYVIEENVAVGNVVIVIEEGLSKIRGNFPLAHVSDGHTGPDGLVRSCKVKNADSQIATKIVQKISEIELAKA